jgi:hypothetical protein
MQGREASAPPKRGASGSLWPLPAGEAGGAATDGDPKGRVLAKVGRWPSPS